jgi:hypothetical protein
MQQLAAEVGLDLNEPPHLCAALQFKSTKMGWGLIRAMTALDRARITQTRALRVLFVQPDNVELIKAKLENDEILPRREGALHLLQEGIARTNFAVEALDDRWNNELIEHTSEPYRRLMSTIEVDFGEMMGHEVSNMNPLLYWLEGRQDVDSMCNDVLDGSQIPEAEGRAMSVIFSTPLTLPEQPAQVQ